MNTIIWITDGPFYQATDNNLIPLDGGSSDASYFSYHSPDAVIGFSPTEVLCRAGVDCSALHVVDLDALDALMPGRPYIHSDNEPRSMAATSMAAWLWFVRTHKQSNPKAGLSA